MLFVFLAAAAACQSWAMRPSREEYIHEMGYADEAGFDDTDVDISVNETVFLFRVNLDWIVSAGFGSRVWIMGSLYEGLVGQQQGRVMAMTHTSAQTWHNFGLLPPVTIAPLEAFQSMLDEKPENTPGPSVYLNRWAMREPSRMLAYQAMAGCWERFDTFILQMFGTAMNKFKRPFDGDYIGMHIRHGDKAKEGRTYDLGTFMSLVQETPKWQDQRNIFVATDDSRVLEQATGSFHPPEGKYEWRWNDFERKVGGEHYANGHDSSERSIRAVLDDTISLALAPVLIGNFNSNFVKLPWLLNYIRRTPEQRKEPWCWDVFTSLPCNDRRDFIVDFVREAIQSDVKYRPANVEDVRECKSNRDWGSV